MKRLHAYLECGHDKHFTYSVKPIPLPDTLTHCKECDRLVLIDGTILPDEVFLRKDT